MDKLQLKAIQTEYETTDLTIDQLCHKHDTTTKQLKGYTKWQKDIICPPPCVLPQSQTEPIHTSIATPATTVNKDTQSKIDKLKQICLERAEELLNEPHLETKEFKDIVHVIDTIDKSYKDLKPQTNIAIMVQNLVGKFTDDC